MSEIFYKIKEAIEIKSTISKHENLLWQKMGEVLELYLTQQSKHTKSEPSDVHGYLNTQQAAEYLGLKYGTLAGWRFYGTGPKYIKLGRSVRYRVKDLQEFADKMLSVTKN